MKDNPSRHNDYLNLLKQELALVKRGRSLDFSSLQSVYLGGGTPSRLTFGNISSLVKWIRKFTNHQNGIEWSIEANPEDVTEDFANELMKIGIQRVSLGVQSFNDDQLLQLKRQHNGNQSRKSIKALINAGIKNLNIDLMFGYPGQSLDDLKSDLKEAIDWKPKHISVYSLTIEPKTAINRMPSWRNWIDKNEALVATMYQLIVEQLEDADLVQYEVSNFCRKGYESRQNLVYWQSENYLGLGTGAHSHCSPFRWGNHKRLVDYKRQIDHGKPPRESYEQLTPAMKRDEDLMLGMRLKAGIHLDSFFQKHNIVPNHHWFSYIESLKNNALVDDCSNQLRFTTKGMLLADEISASLAATLP
jgi:oxygen-independent coproporphyrinogen-3 oxidase